ncbi:MAG TPA: DUF547 domain-containing protein [Candidatus Obscuribacterales bacterium]
MKPLLAFAATLSLLISASGSACAVSFDKSHKLFTDDLAKYVDGELVAYKSWKQERKRLDRYVDTLSSLQAKDYERLKAKDKKALWINAYNAFTVKLVLDHYPIKGTSPYYPSDSLRQIPDVWEAFYITIGGRKVNLYEIEHGILRSQLRDPRTHFAVVCAAKGCAHLRKQAYTGANVEAFLAEDVHRFIEDPRNVRFDFERKVVNVSKLFSWFPLDFASAVGMGKVSFPPPSDDEIVLRYIVANSGPEVRKRFGEDAAFKQYKVVYQPYDWSLNDSGK